ncbi:MAG: acyl-CoA thioesterase [Thermoplasmata archaeon]|nr:thioesterase family protein [Thermoplasmata archaeon]
MGNFIYKYRVAWVDTDNLGVVHFSNYFRICERAEEEFMNSINIPFDATNSISMPRVKAECNYKFPLRFNEIAEVTINVKELGKKHIKYEYQIYNSTQGRISAICEIVVVAIDKNFKSISIPEEIIKIYKNYFNL